MVKILSRQVSKGDVLTFDEKNIILEKKPATLQVLFQDEDVIVINKPAHLLSERLASENGPCVQDRLQQLGFGDTKLCHRLDAGTSGAMILARTQMAATHLMEAFRCGRIGKSYLLLCVGNPTDGAYDEALGKDAFHPRRFAARKNGKEALTYFRTLNSTPHYSLVSARPKTGRTHQIRVHFSVNTHALLGDGLYGGPTRLQLAQQTLFFERPLLHSYCVAFVHPRSQKALHFVAPIASDFIFAQKALQLDWSFDAWNPLW